MARPLRIEIADGVYHVTSRGLERHSIVRSDADRGRWLHLLGAVCTRRDWRIFSWALMDNHFHLFLRTPHADLSAGMHDLNSAYATHFNRTGGRTGPLFQGRFKGILVEREHHYWELTRYIHLNPVRASVARRPTDYPWSSCRAYFDARLAPPWLAWREVLSDHGQSLGKARKSYRSFLRAGVTSETTSPLKEVVASSLLGSEDFVEEIRRLLNERRPGREVPAARALEEKPSLQAIERAVCRAFKTTPDVLHTKGRHANAARAAAVYLCRRLTPTPVARLGRRFGGIAPSSVTHICARVEERCARDRRFRKRILKLEQALGQN